MAGNVLIKNANGNTIILQNPDTNTSDITVDTSNILSKILASSIIPSVNNSIEFQLTSNTQLTIKIKGSDGVVRSANITLA